MIALRRFLSTVSSRADQTSTTDLASLLVTSEDFLGGLREVEPSATREFLVEKGTHGL